MQARGFRRVWAWLWADLGAEGGWGLWWCLWWGLGARVGGQGSDVVMEFLSAAPRPDGIQEAPPSNQKSKLHAELTGSCAREPPSKTSRAIPPIRRDENWVSNHHPAQFRTSAPVTRLKPNPGSYSRCGSAASQASPRALTAKLDRSVRRDRKVT